MAIFRPWEWKKKIFTAMVIFIIVGVVLLLKSLSMIQFEHLEGLEGNWIAGLLWTISVFFLVGSVGSCIDSLKGEGEGDVEKYVSESAGAALFLFMFVVWFPLVVVFTLVKGTGGMIIALIIIVAVLIFLSAILGAAFGVFTIMFTMSLLFLSDFGGFVGSVIGNIIGVSCYGCILKWFGNIKIAGEEWIGRHRAVLREARNSNLEAISTAESLINDLRDLVVKADDLGVHTQAYRNDIDDLEGEIEGLNDRLGAIDVERIEEKFNPDEFPSIKKELDGITSRLSEVSSRIDELKNAISQDIARAERMYNWLVEKGAIRRGQSITPEVLSGVIEIYAKWEELVNDESIENKLSEIREKRSEAQRLLNEYRAMARHDTAGGREARKNLKAAKANLNALDKQIEELERLKKERSKTIQELEDQAKLYVLNSLMGRASAGDVRRMIAVAAKKHRAIMNSLARVETIIADLSGEGYETVKIDLEKIGRDIREAKESLADYEIIKLIGSGGFSDVYKAKRKSDGTLVAIKVPKGALRGAETLDASQYKQFLKEINHWYRLSQQKDLKDGVIAVYDYGTEPFPWIAMEFMAGNLKKVMGSMSLGEKLSLSLHLLSILDRVHLKGVIHRDLKPENIMYNSQGEWKIGDWGLSRKTLGSVATTVSFKGTLEYAAPEQFDPKTFGEVDHRTDIYQMGVVIYEMVTGRVPFRGSMVQVIHSITSKKPRDPREINPRVPEGVSRAILKALAKKKEQRWRHASDFVRALKRRMK